jgi:hypothetical protein
VCCSAFGKDVVEFLLKPDGVIDRNWEGDKPGVLVTFRSMAGDGGEGGGHVYRYSKLLVSGHVL